MVADGMDWDEIIDRWHNSITKEAIAEAVFFARLVFLQHVANLQKEEAA
jgi:hypothetical protein